MRSLRSWAIRTASRRVETPSFRRMDRTWLFAVLTGHGELVGDLAAAQQGGEEREDGELPLAQRCRNLRVHDMERLRELLGELCADPGGR